MRILIRMMSNSNMLINESFLGYVPNAKDPKRIVDSEFNLQIHFPSKYSRKYIEAIAYVLREVYLKLPLFDEFDYKSVKVVRHKPYDGAYFHHISAEVVDKILKDPSEDLIGFVYFQYLRKIKFSKANPISPYDVYLADNSSKSF